MRVNKDWIRKLLIQLTEPASAKAARAFDGKGFEGMPGVEDPKAPHRDVGPNDTDSPSSS